MMSNVYVIVLTVNIVCFITGTALTWSSPELEKFSDQDESPFNTEISLDQRSWISSLASFGAIFGPFMFGYLTDAIGRKNTLLTSGVPYVIGFLMLSFGKEVWIFYLARFLIGLSIGGVFTVVPMYVGEIADDANRGALASIMNVFICAGLFFPYCVGPYVNVMNFNLILTAFSCVFLPSFYFISAETPQYLISRGRYDAAKASLQKIRGSGANVEVELDKMQTNQIKNDESGKGNIMDIFKSKPQSKALGISIGLVFFQQFSGINAILYYAQTIFKNTGSSLEPTVCSIIIGAVQFSTSFLTPFIVDRLGRKILLLVSAVGMIVAEVPLGVYFYLSKHGTDLSAVSFLPIICLIGYIVLYNFGYGPLPWTVMGEIFPTNVKSMASSITAGLCWIFGFLITKYFESISEEIGMGPCFLIFSGFCVAAVPFTMFFVVETKGKNVEEIQNELN